MLLPMIVTTSRHLQFNTSNSILSQDLLSSVLIVLNLPVQVFHLCSYAIPKRMGFSIFTLIIFFLVYLLYEGKSYDYGSNYNSVFEYCATSNSSAVLNWKIVHIPRGYLLAICTFLSALSHMLLYERTYVGITLFS